MATLNDPTNLGEVALYMQKHFNHLCGRNHRQYPEWKYGHGLRVDTTPQGMVLLTATMESDSGALMLKKEIEHPRNNFHIAYYHREPRDAKERLASRLGVKQNLLTPIKMRGYSEAQLHSLVHELYVELMKAADNGIVQNPTPVQAPKRDYGVLA